MRDRKLTATNSIDYTTNTGTAYATTPNNLSNTGRYGLKTSANGSVLLSAKKCFVGCELVDWLLSISSTTPMHITARAQATAMLQVLLEDNVLQHVPNSSFEAEALPQDPTGTISCTPQFEDKYVFYRFC